MESAGITTETLDKLYLELAQFTQARNLREVAARELLEQAMLASSRQEMKSLVARAIAVLME